MNEPSAVKAARILIADDHELVRQGMRAILQSERQWVVCGEATTGLQALTMTIELKPDLVILDVALPGVDPVHNRAADIKADGPEPAPGELDRQGEADVPLTDDPGDRLPAGHQLP